jgi:hypothetical protein
MAGFSKYLAQQILNHTMLAVPFPTVTTHKIILFTADPVDIIQHEVDQEWYVRQTCDAWSAPAEVGVDGTAHRVTNDATVIFGPVSGGGVTVSHWGIIDGINATSLLYVGDIVGGDAQLYDGDTLVFSPGALTVQLDPSE